MSYYRAANQGGFNSIAKLGIESMVSILKHLDNPDKSLKFIHIAGTNGKGSVCAFLSAMLKSAGYKTGVYTSPNMLKVNERISINGALISDLDMERILKKVQTACQISKKETGAKPTQFEIWTAMAICYFAEQKCDYVVLETGLGGRLDATNAVETTIMSVITHIALDHTQYLGNTIKKVAEEKAGIIKPCTKVITAPNQSIDADEVLESICKERNCTLIKAEKILPSRFEEIYEIIDTPSFKNVRLSLGGINQLDNASCAISAAKELGIDDFSICFGLENAVNMGRFENLGENTYIDGAHNPDAISSLKQNLDRYFGKCEKIFIMASMEDKDYISSLKILADGMSEFYAVEVSDSDRCVKADTLAGLASDIGLRARAFSSIADAYSEAKKSGKKIVICGSLYLYKDFMLSQK